VRAAIYPRLSKDRTGLSPNTTIQQVECEEYAADQDWEVVGVFPDNDISASRYTTKPRTGYADLLHAIRANQVEVVLCTEMSRLYRRIDELIDLIKLAEHTRLRRIETTDGYGYDLSTGEGIHNAISAVNNAQLESRKISDRSKRKKKAMARSGLFGGGRRPFGYDYIPAVRNNQGQVIEAGQLVPNEREAQVIKEAVERILAGSSVRSVAMWLNNSGHYTTLGNRWQPSNLKRLLLTKTLLGIREHHYLDPQTHQPVCQAYPATWPAILDEVTFERLRLLLNDEIKFKGMDKRHGRSYLLTGMIFCGVCGSSLVGSGSGKAGVYERGYICRRKSLTGAEVGCGTVSRRAAPVEELIRQAVLAALDSPATLKAIEASEADDSFHEALIRYSQCREELSRIAGLLRRGILSETYYVEQRDEIEAEMARRREQLDRSGTARPLTQVEPGQTLAQAWDTEDLDWRRSLVSLVIRKVIIHPGRPGQHKWITERGSWNFKPESVEITWRV
jgi:site-specific DNA recombinase